MSALAYEEELKHLTRRRPAGTANITGIFNRGKVRESIDRSGRISNFFYQHFIKFTELQESL